MPLLVQPTPGDQVGKECKGLASWAQQAAAVMGKIHSGIPCRVGQNFEGPAHIALRLSGFCQVLLPPPFFLRHPTLRLIVYFQRTQPVTETL